MATASVSNTFVAGTSAVASEVNTNFNDLVSFLNNSVIHKDGSKAFTGNVDAGSNKIVNLTAGTASTDAVTKGQMDTAIAASVADLDLVGWTTYDPTIDQGVNFGIAHTNNYSKYVKNGRTVTWNFNITITAAGATGVLVLYPPITPVSATAWYGAGFIVDASASKNYVGTWGSYNGSTAYIGFYVNEYAGAWGSTPLLTVANGDVLLGSITYEAAS